MSFSYDVDVPLEDGEGTEKVTLVFKDINKIPTGVLRRNKGDEEALMWATFEWGLSAEHLDAFDRLPATEIQSISEAWNESAQRDQDKPVGPPKKTSE